MVEQPGQRHVLFFLAVAGGEFAGVGAQQVVHTVPARPGRLDEVGASQRVQHPADLLEACAGERGGGVGLEVRARVQARQPKRTGGIGVQVAVGPGENRSHRGTGVTAGLQQVQPPLLVGQLRDEVGERDIRAGGGQLGGDSQCQRQPAALASQRRGRVGIIADLRADQLAQQAHRLHGRQQVQFQPGGAVAGHQPGQRITAGHHHRAR